MYKNTILSICILILLAGQTYAGPVSVDISKRGPVNSGVRSLLLPGWGQHFNEQNKKGYIIAGSVLLTIAGSYYLNSKANDTYEDYQNLGVKNSGLYSDYETQSNQAMSVSFLCAGIWLYGVIDAYIFGSDETAEQAGSAGLSLASGKYKTGICYFKKF